MECWWPGGWGSPAFCECHIVTGESACLSALLRVRDHLYSFRPKDSVLTISPLPGLKTRLEGASIFSMLDQIRLKYPHRRPPWTILAQVLTFRTLLCGILQGILVVTKEVGIGFRFPVIRLLIPLMGLLYGTTAYLTQYNY